MSSSAPSPTSGFSGSGSGSGGGLLSSIFKRKSNESAAVLAPANISGGRQYTVSLEDHFSQHNQTNRNSNNNGPARSTTSSVASSNAHRPNMSTISRQNSVGGGSTGSFADLFETTELRSLEMPPWAQEGSFAHTFWKHLNRYRMHCGKIVNDERVQFFIVMLISINAIMLGIGTFDFIQDNDDAKDAFELVDKIFLIIFTIELGFQFLYHGYRLIADGWLAFDLIIITVSWSFNEVQIIRAFRIFRALRLVTRIKVMKNLIVALFSVMPRMAAIGLLLFLIFYIFAVMFTNLFKDLWHDGDTDFDYFSRIDSTFFTLFQLMTLDNWADVTRQVVAVFKWAWAPMLAFVIISGFIVVNLIIAVICDAIAALNDDDRAKLQGNYDNESEDGEIETLDPVDVQEKLDTLEGQVEELSKMQAKTMMLLRELTAQLPGGAIDGPINDVIDNEGEGEKRKF
mmetsp:Transcript_16696/g.23545  ORF Transcript_16696/g.23545 Transcript_16696/m.23545 type:complete len:456 (+) Transcript_16696:184-1551(+)